MHPAKTLIKIFNQAKIQQLHQEKGKLPKIKIGEIKADTLEAHTHVIPEVDEKEKVTSDWKEPVHTSIIPYQALRESTMRQI